MATIALSHNGDVGVVVVTAAGSSECYRKPPCTAEHYTSHQSPCLNGQVHALTSVFALVLVAWRSGSVIWRANKVTLHRARHMVVNNLPKVITQQRNGVESNS